MRSHISVLFEFAELEFFFEEKKQEKNVKLEIEIESTTLVNYLLMCVSNFK